MDQMHARGQEGQWQKRYQFGGETVLVRSQAGGNGDV
jgi:hypothetical protein